MSTVADYRAALQTLPLDAHPGPVGALLSAVLTAWLLAEEGIPSEQESRRWSPVCDAAMHVAETYGDVPA